MNENDFYTKLLNLPNLVVDTVSEFTSKIIINCHILCKECVCPNCGTLSKGVNQHTKRTLQDLSIVGKEVSLKVLVPQFHCSECKRYFSSPLGFADANKNHTHRQAKWIFELCEQQPFTAVAALVNLSHVTVQTVYYEQAERALKQQKRFANVRKIGIDEFAHRKGKGNFCCVITDLERGIVLDILPNRKKETILSYFKTLGAEVCGQIEVVACDIWDSYIAVGNECFPNAQITLDRFHLVKLLNECLDSLRKTLRKADKNAEEYKKLKWILYKQPDKCTEEERLVLATAFAKSPLLQQLYTHRNDFHNIYNQAKDATEMANLLTTWTEKAENLAQSFLDKFVKTVRNRIEYIASYANTHVTNAVTEGLNNLIRHVKRISFGMPDFQHLRLRTLLRSS